MNDLSPFQQIGKLFTHLSWVSTTQLENALSRSRDLSLPLGLVLVEQGLVSRNELNAVIEAQSDVRDQLVNPIHATMALTIVGWSSVTFKTALKFLGLESQKFVDANKIGRLLIDSKIITVNQFNSALQAASLIGLPIGQFLLMHKHISQQCLDMSLSVQRLIRERVLTRREAVRALTLSHSKIGIGEAAVITVPLLPDLRLGELLVLANIVSRDDIKLALELAEVNKRNLGEILSVFVLVPKSILAAALEIQQMLRRGELTVDESISSLAQAYQFDIPIAQALINCRKHRGSQTRKQTLANFLELVNVIDKKDVAQITDACMDSTTVLNKFQDLDRPIDKFAMSTAARLNFLVKAAVLTLDAACFVFHHCLANRVDADQFLKQAGWFRPTEPGSEIFVAANGTFALV